MDKGKIRLTENVAWLLLGGGIVALLLAVVLFFGKLQAAIFSLMIIFSYKLTDYYVWTLKHPEKSFRCWPNLIVLFDVTKDPIAETRRKQSANCHHIQTNPWVHLMISERLDSAIDQFCGLCLREYIDPWLSTITDDQSFVHEVKHVLRYLLATSIRRLQNTHIYLRVLCVETLNDEDEIHRLIDDRVDINAFLVQRFLPLIFQTCDRYIHIRGRASLDDPVDFLRKMYKNDLHLAMYNRHTELRYLKQIILDLMPIITPKFISECKGTRHLLCELFAGQVVLDGIDTLCQPNILNRLFHLYFITAIQRRQMTIPSNPMPAPNTLVEILSHFCALEKPLHKNRLALALTDVTKDKELIKQFSRVLDRHGTAGLLSIHQSLIDVLEVMPLAADISVRRKIYQRLKDIEEQYFNPLHSDTYLEISNPSDRHDTLIDDVKYFITHDLEASINEAENDKSSNESGQAFDIQRTFNLLLNFDCRIHELIEDKYQRAFLTSDEHFLDICGQRMDSPDYRLTRKTNVSGRTNKYTPSRHYTTTSYYEWEENDDVHLKYSEDTASICSASSLDERDLSQWHVRIDRVEELRESLHTNSRYGAFIIEVQRVEPSTDSPLIHPEEKPRCIVARRYQDFYLLEQKLIEFHGIFSDARLPPRRSATTARNLDFLQSMKHDFEHVLRHLLSKPTLRNSELLYNFLTQPDDFTLPNGEIVLSKVFKIVPRRLRTEKGQNLEPFLLSLLNYAEPPKRKTTQSTPVFNDIVEEKLRSSIYGNNANITEPFFEPLTEDTAYSTNKERDSTYDHLVFIVKQVFSASSVLIHLLDLFRVPLKNTFDSFFAHFVETRIDELLSNDENIIDVIHALRDAIFPDVAKEKGPTDMVNFEDVIAAAEEFIPHTLKRILGESNVCNGLQVLLEHFQDPLLNKQLFYTILDEALFQLFPELQLRYNASRSSTMATA